LGGHGVQPRAGIGLNVLDGFLEAAHGRVELVDAVRRLFDESALDGVVLGHLGLHFFLTLQQRGDIALQLDDLARHGEGGAGPDEAAGDGADEHGAGEKKNVTHPHGCVPPRLRPKANEKDDGVTTFQCNGRLEWEQVG